MTKVLLNLHYVFLIQVIVFWSDYYFTRNHISRCELTLLFSQSFLKQFSTNFQELTPKALEYFRVSHGNQRVFLN